MTSRERMLAAIARKKPDVLPVTTHHVMPYFLKKQQNGIAIPEFFRKFGFDAINWHTAQLPNAKNNEYIDETQGTKSFLDSTRIISDQWQLTSEQIPDNTYNTVRYTITTPEKKLSMVLQSNAYTTWIIDFPIKEDNDIEILEKYLPMPLADLEGSKKAKEEIGDGGIVRSHIPSTIDMFGQPGTWQDACCMVGTQDLILKTYDDPKWVHRLLSVILKRKQEYIKSLKGSAYDIVELGGGDGCTSVISPAIFDEFVAPYDKILIDEAHKAGQRITYHLCGCKMALLDSIAEMGMDALETLTPVAMGGDSNLKVIKEKLGKKMCLIGGFDQNNYFVGCSEQATRDAVRKCFDEAGGEGGYIISPSDHFFDAEDRLLFAFADEAHRLKY
jgi:uroporphyrinogen decarboxylase